MQIKKSYVILGVVAVVLLVIVGSCVGTRNSIVELDQASKRAWGDVESSYQRRLDLIPNLVNTVKGYAAHESTTLQNVTDARVGRVNNEGNALNALVDSTKAELNNPNVSAEQQRAALEKLEGQYSIYINAVHEAYPDLKANENFLGLQDELAGTENRINKARDDYNKAVEAYNAKILKFPGSLFAWGYEEKNMFKADARAATAPTVDFGTSASPSVQF